MSTTVIQITVVFNGFCDTELAPYYGEALTCHLLKVDGSGPRVNIEVDSGPFHIRPSGVPSGHQPKAPAHTVRFYILPAIPVIMFTKY